VYTVYRVYKTVSAKFESRWAILAIASAAQLLVVLDATVVNLALPTIRTNLGMPGVTVAWVVDAYTLCFAALLLAGDRLADRFGPRRIFLIGVSVFGLASLAAAGSQDSVQLIAARALQGSGAALVCPSALATLLARYREPNERRRALAVWTLLGGLGATIGVAAGGVLVQSFGWRSVFLINVPVCLIVLVGGIRSEQHPPPFQPADQPDRTWLTTARWSLMVAGLVGAVLSLNSRGGGALAIGFAAAAGFAAVAILGLRSRSRGEPTRLRVRGLARGAAGQALLGAIQGSVLFLLSFQTQRTLHLPSLVAGISFLPMGFAAVAAGITGSILQRKWGMRRTWAVAAAACLFGLIALDLFSGTAFGLAGVFAAVVGHRRFAARSQPVGLNDGNRLRGQG
jgi:MFS family permease